MKVKYIYVATRNFTPGKIYEAIGENDKGNCYLIKSTDKGKCGYFRINKFQIVDDEEV